VIDLDILPTLTLIRDSQGILMAYCLPDDSGKVVTVPTFDKPPLSFIQVNGRFCDSTQSIIADGSAHTRAIALAV